MRKLTTIGIVASLFIAGNVAAQGYSLDITPPERQIMSGHLKMGNPGPAKSKIEVNNRYVSIGGKPVVPVMGELHFSRVKKEEWRDYLLKMKSAGITVVASYVIWMHHEEAEGNFDWSGNKDFRAFAKLCGELGLYVYPRIGPWCHGEVRNGGTPDWILAKKLIGNRTNDAVYQSYVSRYFAQVFRQVDGLLYKDGGPVIGVQLENEYWRGKDGEAHILWLKKCVRDLGFDVPMYTVTGWGNVSVPEDEVIPLFGDYPEEPWADNVTKPSSDKAFFFDTGRDSQAIGNEQLKKDGKYVVDIARYPYLTCELGVGNQLSYHRRPIIDQRDGLALALVKVGSGSNLPGYYVFAGGTNPDGIFSPMQEDQHETGMHNEYPAKSYDFQAAITETGELAPSYFQVKKLHQFLDEFGSVLAPYLPVFPAGGDKYKDLQYAVRSDGNSGFLFIANYLRGSKRPLYKGVRFDLKMKDGSSLVFPSSGVDIPDSTLAVWPFNFNLGGVNLRYATAQPLSALSGNRWVFSQDMNIAPEFAISAAGVSSVTSSSGKVTSKDGNWVVSGIKAAVGEHLAITAADGTTRTIYLISDLEARRSWIIREAGEEHFIVSDAGVTWDLRNDRKIYFKTKSPKFSVSALSTTGSLASSINIGENVTATPVASPKGWMSAQISFKQAKQPKVSVSEVPLFDRAAQLKANVDQKSSKQELWQRFFYKEFGLYNTSDILSAKMHIYSDLSATLRVNNVYVNQKPAKGAVSVIDITGYVKSGENLLQIGVPLETSPARISAVIEVYFRNGERVEIPSGADWLTSTQYLPPSLWASLRGAQPSEVLKERVAIKATDGVRRYRAYVPVDAFDGLSALYLSVGYSGDSGRCYLNQRFVWDNLNNATAWRMNLKTLDTGAEGATLDILIDPMSDEAKIRLDKPVTKTASLDKWSVEPEYMTTFGIGK